jgi:hypothetical protein
MEELTKNNSPIPYKEIPLLSDRKSVDKYLKDCPEKPGTILR